MTTLQRLLHRLCVASLFLCALHAGAKESRTALDRYVAQPDTAFASSVAQTTRLPGATAYIIDLTSQSYLTTEEVNRPQWRHWLSVVVPDEVPFQTGMLIIGGGSNGDEQPAETSEVVANFALRSRSVVAELLMVPNQPIKFSDENAERVEDAFIAYTWDRYLKTGDEKWPARLPMTKSAVAAMDAIQALIRDRHPGASLDNFVVAGGSKRGWTTWTTGAVDARVRALVPIVIDALNVQASFEHHWRTYGFWAPAVADYVDMGLMQWWRSAEMNALFELVDPYAYRERFTMPKYIVNATGDEFFVPTSSQFYFDDLPGEKHLRYVPNANHSLADTDALQTILAFYATLLMDEPRPQIRWSVEDGVLQVHSDTTPAEAVLWNAHNPSARDFRVETIGRTWRPQTIEARNKETNTYQVNLPVPETGWQAHLVELTFMTTAGLPLKLTTPVYVTPNALPFEYVAPESSPPGGFLSTTKRP